MDNSVSFLLPIDPSCGDGSHRPGAGDPIFQIVENVPGDLRTDQWSMGDPWDIFFML